MSSNKYFQSKQGSKLRSNVFQTKITDSSNANNVVNNNEQEQKLPNQATSPLLNCTPNSRGQRKITQAFSSSSQNNHTKPTSNNMIQKMLDNIKVQALKAKAKCIESSQLNHLINISQQQLANYTNLDQVGFDINNKPKYSPLSLQRKKIYYNPNLSKCNKTFTSLFNQNGFFPSTKGKFPLTPDNNLNSQKYLPGKSQEVQHPRSQLFTGAGQQFAQLPKNQNQTKYILKSQHQQQGNDIHMASTTTNMFNFVSKDPNSSNKELIAQDYKGLFVQNNKDFSRTFMRYRSANTKKKQKKLRVSLTLEKFSNKKLVHKFRLSENYMQNNESLNTQSSNIIYTCIDHLSDQHKSSQQLISSDECNEKSDRKEENEDCNVCHKSNTQNQITPLQNDDKEKNKENKEKNKEIEEDQQQQQQQNNNDGNCNNDDDSNGNDDNDDDDDDDEYDKDGYWKGVVKCELKSKFKNDSRNFLARNQEFVKLNFLDNIQPGKLSQNYDQNADRTNQTNGCQQIQDEESNDSASVLINNKQLNFTRKPRKQQSTNRSAGFRSYLQGILTTQKILQNTSDHPQIQPQAQQSNQGKDISALYSKSKSHQLPQQPQQQQQQQQHQPQPKTILNNFFSKF